MVVCVHGEMDALVFCAKHGLQVFELYRGSLDEYGGSCAVIVTDEKMTREKYESLKCSMFGRGYELVSTEWTDDEVILALLRQTVEQRGKRGGRQIFGFTKRNGMIVEIPERIAVARKVIAMRDAGYTLEKIRDTEGVRHADGKKLAKSTIQQIVKNREKYEI